MFHVKKQVLFAALLQVTWLAGCGGQGASAPETDSTSTPDVSEGEPDLLPAVAAPTTPYTPAVPTVTTNPVLQLPTAPTTPTKPTEPLGPSTPIDKNFATTLSTRNEAARFLMQAAIGGTSRDINDLVGTNASDWLSAEFAKGSGDSYIKRIQTAFPGQHSVEGRPGSKLLWQSMIQDEDQLRLRMSYALSQIIVASDIGIGEGALTMAHYMDILEENAFGNYRDLLDDITYSPMMARYLTYLKNKKANPKTGSEPDENYAREIMQLFTIGLVQLNADGTLKLDENGKPLETYTNDDIVGLSRVFTGLSYNLPGFNDLSQDTAVRYQRLKMFEDKHSERDKTFLGSTIPAGTTGEESIRLALDTLFAHPNVGPFVSRQLIQRFTASNPTPAYIGRVSAAFDSGTYISEDGVEFGTAQRGDLRATLAAILLDKQAHLDTSQAIDVTAGKVREPVLRYLQFVRAFNSAPIDVLNSERRLFDTSDPAIKLGQHPMRSRSVFNFYRPGFVAPNTLSGDAGLTVPELQIVNDGSAIGYVNFLTDYTIKRWFDETAAASLVPDYSAEIAMANDAEALVDHIDTVLTAGSLSGYDRQRILNIVKSIDIEASTSAEDRVARVHAAVIATVSSSAYASLY